MHAPFSQKDGSEAPQASAGKEGYGYSLTAKKQ